MANKSSTSSKLKGGKALNLIHPWVAGIDIGSKEHWVCGPRGQDDKSDVCVLGTTTPELHKLVEWLRERDVKSVAMESTYVYWIPVYEVLEAAGFEVLLVNARTLKNVPGRKTDMHDCQWLQLLHSCGLLRGSFRPNAEVCQMRTIQRQRANLIEERSRVVHWMQKSLDQMNVRVHRAVSDITGVTGLAIIRAIVSGERDPLKLAAMRDRRCKKSKADIAEELTGTWHHEHLFNLKSALNLYDTLENSIAEYDHEILRLLSALTPEERCDASIPEHSNRSKQQKMRKHGMQELREALWRFCGQDLTLIDGISAETARVIVTELGPGLTEFPSEKHFVSWLHLCPRNGISGGKPVKGRQKNGQGSSRVGASLRMAAVSLQRGQTALGAEYRRIARRKSARVAVFAVARKLAQIVYRLLRFGKSYTDVGTQAYERRFEQRRRHALEQNAAALGFRLEPLPATSG